MDSKRPTDHDRRAPDAARRVLVAVHGREPAAWELEVGRALAASPRATVRVLALIDVPAPPSAALLPCARRARAWARAEWRRLEAARVRERVDALLRCLSSQADVVRLDVTDADPAGAIVEQAGAWGAELIVLGAEPARGLARRLLGATHERVVARAPCAVLVVTPPEPGPARARGRVAAGGRGPVAAKGGA